MRQPDTIYSDILPRDIDLYINYEDVEGHKLEAVTGPNGEQRYDILVWLKEEN